MRYCWLFPAGIPHRRVGTHVFLSRSPLPPRRVNVRLACIRHAASVDPEPGSNSSSCVSRAAPCRNSGHARSILIMHQACDERLSIHPRHTRQLVRYRSHRRQKTEGVATTRSHHIIVCCCLPAPQVKHLYRSTWWSIPSWTTAVKPTSEALCIQEQSHSEHKPLHTHREQRVEVYHAASKVSRHEIIADHSCSILIPLPHHMDTYRPALHGNQGPAYPPASP